jgi:hypothetical protein
MRIINQQISWIVTKSLMKFSGNEIYYQTEQLMYKQTFYFIWIIYICLQ